MVEKGMKQQSASNGGGTTRLKLRIFHDERVENISSTREQSMTQPPRPSDCVCSHSILKISTLVVGLLKYDDDDATCQDRWHDVDGNYRRVRITKYAEIINSFD